jgi:1,4-alpha-glucan branching enzyme
MNKQKTKIRNDPGDQRIEREYSKDMKSCKVKFVVPREIASDANSIAVAGTFNDWNQQSHQLEKQENGDFRLDMVLEPDRDYEFRFVVDGERWGNAHNADKYYWSDYSNCDNSVIET